MTKYLVIAGISLLTCGSISTADEPRTLAKSEHKATEATFLITGLHCPPCTKTVEQSLSKAKGISSIKVDWKSKNARIVFDESVIPAQQVAEMIADTPHMMGKKLHYGGWLALNVDEVQDDATGKPIKDVLSNVKGVKSVALYPKQHMVGVEFAAKGQVTDQQLLDLLTKRGYHAKNL